MIASAQKAIDEGIDIADDIGIIRYTTPTPKERITPSFGPQGAIRTERKSEFIVDIDLNKYLKHVASSRPLKSTPAFDSKDVANGKPSAENNAFGNKQGESANFTEYALRKATANPNATLSEETIKRVKMMNPMNFIDDKKATVAKNWYIRHGAIDRDTGVQIPINLTTKLTNNGYNVDFALPWNRPHAGDYNLNDLFKWIEKITNTSKNQ